MNERQAAALKSVIEAGHPDAATTVTALRDSGAEVVISGGPQKAPGLSGPGGSADVVLRLGENSPFLLHFLAARLARTERAVE